MIVVGNGAREKIVCVGQLLLLERDTGITLCTGCAKPRDVLLTITPAANCSYQMLCLRLVAVQLPGSNVDLYTLRSPAAPALWWVWGWWTLQ